MGTRIVAATVAFLIAVGCQEVSSKTEGGVELMNLQFEERLNCSTQYQYRDSKSGVEYASGASKDVVIAGTEFKDGKIRNFVVDDTNFIVQVEARPKILLARGGDVASDQKSAALRVSVVERSSNSMLGMSYATVVGTGEGFGQVYKITPIVFPNFTADKLAVSCQFK